MRNTLCGAVALGLAVISGPAMADETWNNGVLFTQQELAPVVGHTAFKIVFGLEPGKCTDEITTVSEWLIMREGTLTQTYPGKGAIERVPGKDWFHPAGTKVVVCNKSDKKAVLEGVQFRPK